MAAVSVGVVNRLRDNVNPGVCVIEDITDALCKIFRERFPKRNCQAFKMYWSRKKRLKHYDLCVNLSSVSDLRHDQEWDERLFPEISSALMEMCNQWKVPLEGCTIMRHHQIQMNLKLNRTAFAEVLLSSVINRKDDFIHKTGKNKSVSVHLPTLANDCTEKGCNLTTLRTFIIFEMLCRILEAVGCEVESPHLFNTVGRYYEVQDQFCTERLLSCGDKLVPLFPASKLFLNWKCQLIKSAKPELLQCSQDASATVSTTECCNALKKSVYDNAGEPVKQACDADVHKRNQEDEMMFMVVSHRRQHRLQTLESDWEPLAKSYDKPRFMKIMHSLVIWKDSPTNANMADLFFRMQFDIMKRSYLHKYGLTDNGQLPENDDMNEMFADLAAMNVKFQLLACSLETSVTVTCLEDLSQKGGIFVMYNYARLCALLSSFEKRVQQQQFPPLPPLSETDFATLKKEEEWNLILMSSKYTQIIDEISSSLLSSPSTLGTPPLHKIIGFLNALSRELSCYYSHVHILCEPVEHLRSGMYARIWLLTLVKQIFESAFRLMNVTPIQRM